jgi:hypothetical protein
MFRLKPFFYICLKANLCKSWLQTASGTFFCVFLLFEEQKERENYVIALDNIGRRRAIFRLLYS